MLSCYVSIVNLIYCCVFNSNLKHWPYGALMQGPPLLQKVCIFGFNMPLKLLASTHSSASTMGLALSRPLHSSFRTHTQDLQAWAGRAAFPLTLT